MKTLQVRRSDCLTLNSFPLLSYTISMNDQTNAICLHQKPWAYLHAMRAAVPMDAEKRNATMNTKHSVLWNAMRTFRNANHGRSTLPVPCLPRARREEPKQCSAESFSSHALTFTCDSQDSSKVLRQRVFKKWWIQHIVWRYQGRNSFMSVQVWLANYG